MTGETFTRDPEFDLEAYARGSFGGFQERPVDVVLRFAAGAMRDASGFLFDPGQSIEEIVFREERPCRRGLVHPSIVWQQKAPSP